MITERAERQRTKYSPIPATPETHKIIKMECVRLGITLMEMMDKVALSIQAEDKR